MIAHPVARAEIIVAATVQESEPEDTLAATTDGGGGETPWYLVSARFLERSFVSKK